jgi:putative Ca2+/H+ antiporter (TMEM165/GDT1 family)
VGFAFIAFGLWTLHPDSLDDSPRLHQAGAFVTALVAFFVVEMGDKTQLATVALAARFHALWEVVLGTTLGMMLANIPAVWIGDRLATRMPMHAIRITAAVLFILVGALTLLGPAQELL